MSWLQCLVLCLAKVSAEDIHTWIITKVPKVFGVTLKYPRTCFDRSNMADGHRKITANNNNNINRHLPIHIYIPLDVAIVFFSTT